MQKNYKVETKIDFGFHNDYCYDGEWVSSNTRLKIATSLTIPLPLLKTVHLQITSVMALPFVRKNKMNERGQYAVHAYIL